MITGPKLDFTGKRKLTLLKGLTTESNSEHFQTSSLVIRALVESLD